MAETKLRTWSVLAGSVALALLAFVLVGTALSSRPDMKEVGMAVPTSLASSTSDAPQARDGFGNPVEWFFVVKMPALTFPSDDLSKIQDSLGAADFNRSSVHCDCPDPECPMAAAPDSHREGRGAGLCYLYADSNHPEVTLPSPGLVF